MKLQRVYNQISDLTDQHLIPQGIIDEGRIFALGSLANAENHHKRVVEVVEGLKEHVGQPFELHPWAFVIDLSTYEADGETKPMTLVEVVLPQKNGAVFVTQYYAMRKRIQLMDHFIFNHTPKGTVVTISPGKSLHKGHEERASMSFYPLAIAVLNTRGCQVDLKRAPSITNVKRKRQGKHPIPAHYDVDTTEYLTALGPPVTSTDRGGTHASPIPHLRRGHERVLPSGNRVWVSSALVNVRNEGDIAFVEHRKAYRRGEKGQDTGG